MSLRDKAFSIITHTKNGYIGGYYVEDRGTRYDGGLVVAIEDAEAAVEEAREDGLVELDAVMQSVDKWFDEGDERLKLNPATRACDAREIALRAIEANPVYNPTESVELIAVARELQEAALSDGPYKELLRELVAALERSEREVARLQKERE